jgi:outer membrane protein assembly factor BamB
VNGSPAAPWAFWDPHPSPNNDFGTISVLTDSTGMAMRVFSGTNTGHLFAVDATSGTMYFDFNTSSHVGTISKVRSNGALATINGTTELVFASGCDGNLDCPKGTANGYLWALNALSNAPNGTLLWQSKNFGGDIVSSPLIVNQGNNAVIFVLGPWMPGIASRGDLLALDPMTGRLLADYAVFNHAYGTVSSPAVSGGQIYVTEGYAVFKNPNPGTGGLAAFKCPGC